MVVWTVLLGNTIIVTLFIEVNITGELFLNLFEEIIDPLITSSENQIGAAGNMSLQESSALVIRWTDFLADGSQKRSIKMS